MIPGGINPKQMKKMMKRMGVKVEEIEADSVIIRSVDKDIVIESPQVLKTEVGGQTTYQISGDVLEAEVEAKLSIEEEDIKMVSEQAGVSEKKAKEALEDSNGDIAEAIMKLRG